MRNYLFFLFLGINIFCIQDSFAQSEKISLDIDGTLAQLFDEIERSTDYIFLYKEDVPVNERISVHVKNETIESILNKVLAKEGYSYRINDKQIFITNKENKTKNVSGQNSVGNRIVITGKVTDADGEGMPGANVILKDSTMGTITDADGRFSIEVPEDGTIICSFLGYYSREISIKGKNDVRIELQENINLLDDLVVIGYGFSKKKDLTGSVSVVSKKDFNQGIMLSPQDLITGKIPGVVITNNGGSPGSPTNIRIRGGSSLKASNDPLIIVDGVPVDNNGIAGLANPLSTVNPNDIESFTVLKDASAAAIYGSRASNGVILITTKRGGDRQEITYSGNFSIQTLPQKIDVFDADEYHLLIAEERPEELNLLGDSHTDWQDEIYQNVFSQDHNLSISGPSKWSPYVISFGYTNQNGILKTSNVTRGTIKTNINPSFFDQYLKFNLNLNASYNQTRFPNNSVISLATQMDPTQPVKNGGDYQDGYFAWLSANGGLNSQAPANPVAMLELTNNVAKIYRLLGNFQTDYTLHFFPKIRLNLNLAGDYSYTDGVTYIPENTSWTTASEGSDEIYTQNKRMELFDFYINYLNDISKLDCRLDVTGGYSLQHFWQDTYSKRTNAAGTTVLSEIPSKTQNYLLTFFGRLNYTQSEKYLLTITLCYDASSRFSKKNRWGLFPSIATAWKIKKESFMKNFSKLSDLKLRLSYGVTGQQDIGTNDYPYLSKYVYSSPDNTAQYQLGNTFYNTLRPSEYEENIKWEETKTYNLGIDFGFFNDRLGGSVDLYYRKTFDLLNRIPASAGTNLSNYITTNVGDLENKGIEVALNMVPVLTHDVKWEFSCNLFSNKNKILKLTQSDDPKYIGVQSGSISGSSSGTIQINSVGYPINSFYVYKQVYDENGKPIEGKYENLDDNPTINSGDLYRYEKITPDVLMGFSSRFVYEKWDFTFIGRWSVGNYVYNNVKSSKAVYDELYSLGATKNILKAVRETNFQERQLFSDYYVEDASFFKADNIALGYLFSGLFKGKGSLYLSASVQNLFTITNYSGIDPEVYNGIDNAVYPRPRTYLLNLNLNF